MRENFPRLLIALFVLVLGVNSGCGQGTASTKQSSRLEHHEAAHHPTSFADAIGQLERRDGRIQAASRGGASPTLKREIKEMLDILEWLPTIAADTDLKKRDWEAVKQQATQLTGFYNSYAAATTTVSVPPDVSREACRKAIESLRGFVPAADRRL